MKPKSAVIGITYRCNSRCTMCDIWKKTDGPPEVSADFYLRLPESLREINLSGGEPFLRRDMPEIIANIRRRCRSARIVISTNGLLPERATELLGDRTWVGVRVSIDGLEAEHDKIRGVPGAYRKAMETLDRLQAAGFRDLGISYTVSEHSQPQLAALKRIADERGLEFTCSVAHSSDFYFGEQQSEPVDQSAHLAELSWLQRHQLKSGRPKEWGRAYYTEGLLRRLRGEKRMIPCYALDEFFYLDPYGDVYPCNVLNQPIGNLGQADYAELYARASEQRAKVARCPVQCWMVCTAAPAMRRYPWIPGWWIVKRKLTGEPR